MTMHHRAQFRGQGGAEVRTNVKHAVYWVFNATEPQAAEMEDVNQSKLLKDGVWRE
jgi:hypothetical protein